MADFIRVPVERLQAEVLDALLEEFASRNGTDYGHYDMTLEQKVANLRRQLDNNSLQLLYDGASETWDLLDAEAARALLS